MPYIGESIRAKKWGETSLTWKVLEMDGWILITQKRGGDELWAWKGIVLCLTNLGGHTKWGDRTFLRKNRQATHCASSGQYAVFLLLFLDILGGG